MGFLYPSPQLGVSPLQASAPAHSGAGFHLMQVYTFLQIVSSVAGVLILCLWIRSWYRATRPAPQPLPTALASGTKDAGFDCDPRCVNRRRCAAWAATYRNPAPPVLYGSVCSRCRGYRRRPIVVATCGMGSAHPRRTRSKYAAIRTHTPLVRSILPTLCSLLPTPFSLFPVFSA